MPGSSIPQPTESFRDAFNRICRESTSSVEQGRRCEDLFVRLVRSQPEFDVQDVWTWQEWPERAELTGRGAQDLGIDLIARLNDGSLVAIQCKCYCEPRHKVSKREIDSFLAESSRDCFDLRWIVATSDWTNNAERAIEGLTPPVRRIDFHSYGDTPFDNSASAPVRVPRPPRGPRPLQARAIADVLDGLQDQNQDRGKLIMACGTGKTYVALRVAEGMVPETGHVLFAAPSISLVSQARREWLEHSRRPMSSLVVCSDPTAGGARWEVGPDDLVCPVESDPRKIADHLASRSGVKVVFCTYHSLRQVVKAQSQHGAPSFHLAIADEAHRTTGIDSEQKSVNFQLFHRADDLRADKRLYMTATPRIYTEASKAMMSQKGLDVKDMNDLDVYGPQLHHLRFKDAVAADLLSDYRVIVLGVRESDLSDELRARVATAQENPSLNVGYSDAARLMGAYLAMNGHVEGSRQEVPERLQRAIAYASTIRRSSWFADTFNDERVQAQFLERIAGDEIPPAEPMQVEAKHLEAKDNALVRNRWLRRLNDVKESDEALLLSNVRIFSEGVDVPALDAVAFLDPRGSQIDVVQAVGRVMRKAEGKEFGYIIVPVFMPEGVQNVAEELARRGDGYRSIGLVLRALLSHDERLADSLARFVIIGESSNGDSAPVNGKTNGAPDETSEAIRLAQQARLELGEEGIYAHVASASGLGVPGHVTALTIEDSVRRAARHMADSGAVTDALRTIFEMPGADDREAATVAALMLFNACLMHKRLKESASGMKGIVGMDEIARAKEPAERLRGPWQTILRQDFDPIIRPALSLLEAIPYSALNVVDRAITTLAECAVNLDETQSDLGYDHAGPLYHRILGSARSDGAFYTNHVSALMLAGMVFADDLVNWSDAEAIKRLKILDPACGTGTLLMAALDTIKRKGQEHGAFTEQELPGIHQHLVQNSIYGLDINYQATQLAAANLTLGAPSVDYERMHIHTMQHGPTPEGQVRLGSLELLADAVRGEQLGLFDIIRQAPIRDTAGLPGGEVPDLRDVDVVLMNPPFTNNRLRGRQYTQATVKQMQAREGKIKGQVTAVDQVAGTLIDANSVATYFSPLVEALLNRRRGRFGSVVPTTACVGTAGLRERKFFADRFHVRYVVTSHDPSAINFSENTGIHETLLVRSRRTDANCEAPTSFISLRRMPRSSTEVQQWLADLHSDGESNWHRVNEWPRERVAAGDWSPAQWFDGDLALIPTRLAEHRSLKAAGDLARIGPAGQRVSDAFVNPTRTPDQDTRATYPVMWNHKPGIRRTMLATPDFKMAPKESKFQYATERLWPNASSLLIASRIDTIKVRTPAVFVAEPVLGSAWTPVTPETDLCDHGVALFQAWCAYLNSSVAAASFLNSRSKKLTYPKYSLEQLRSIPLPDPRACDITPLVRAFDNLCQQELLPWPQMHIDPVRHQIDGAVCEVLSLDPDEVADWRRRIVAEPTVSNQPAP